MAICAVCYKNCRGTCAKCGARLCHTCMPKNKRAKCQMCRTSNPVQSPYYTPPQAPTAYAPAQATPYYIPPEKDFEDMNKTEVLVYLQETFIWLTRKKQRERDYLDKRASRPGHRPTPTDTAYEDDQPKEERLLKLLTYWYNEASK